LARHCPDRGGGSLRCASPERHLHAFAGANLEHAVVPEAVQQMMVAFDATVEHYEVVV
jgi:hypothetical protein